MAETKAVTVEVVPSTTQMDVVATTTKVRVEVAESTGLPTHAKLAHLLAAAVSGVLAVCVAAVLADGISVIKLKDPMHLPIATNLALRDQGLYHRLDELLGPTYGVGLHHDQSGSSWTEMMAGSTLRDLEANLGIPVIIAALPSVISTDDLKHPVAFLKCDQLQAAGLTACIFGFIALIASVLMLVVHTAALAGLVPARLGKLFAGLIWGTLSAGFMVVCFLAVGIYTSLWQCDNTFIPSIRLVDHFEYNYGFYFAFAGLLSALLVFFVQLVATSTKEDDKTAPGICKFLCTVVPGVGAGLALALVGSYVILGSNGYYDPPAAPDPNYNPCASMKPYHAGPNDHYFSNVQCMRDSVVQVLEQAGANVTRGFVGGLDAGDRVPITGAYADHGLCPVNVHWHLGAEHYSAGEYDEAGSGPHHAPAYPPSPAPPPQTAVTANATSPSSPSPPPPLAPPPTSPSPSPPAVFVGGRRMAASSDHSVRQGFQCRHYDASDTKFTTPFNWVHCDSTMEVGQTYEIHWPHSAAGACGTEYQYQSPFYDGVFCRSGVITIAPLNTYTNIGVQAQIFTIVNDESYYYPNLIDGARTGGDFWSDVAMYTGSTTGTSRDNTVCSRYTPITWQVDRKCHLISASSFEKMCMDMRGMRDDMSSDLHAHGARTLVAQHLTASNQQSR